MSIVPADIRAIAEQAAREELADYDEVRQIAKHVGSVIIQVAWPAIEAHFAVPAAAAGPGTDGGDQA